MICIIVNVSSIDPGIRRFAYYLRKAAAEIGIQYCRNPAAKDKQAVSEFLGDLITKIETERATLGITQEQEAADIQYMEKIAISLFSRANGDDRNSSVTKESIINYRDAATYLECVRISAPNTTQTKYDDMAKFAKFRASVILKNLKAGTPHTPPEGSSGDFDLDSELERLGGNIMGGTTTTTTTTGSSYGNNNGMDMGGMYNNMNGAAALNNNNNYSMITSSTPFPSSSTTVPVGPSSSLSSSSSSTATLGNSGNPNNNGMNYNLMGMNNYNNNGNNYPNNNNNNMNVPRTNSGNNNNNMYGGNGMNYNNYNNNNNSKETDRMEDVPRNDNFYNNNNNNNSFNPQNNNSFRGNNNNGNNNNSMNPMYPIGISSSSSSSSSSMEPRSPNDNYNNVKNTNNNNNNMNNNGNNNGGGGGITGFISNISNSFMGNSNTGGFNLNVSPGSSTFKGQRIGETVLLDAKVFTKHALAALNEGNPERAFGFLVNAINTIQHDTLR